METPHGPPEQETHETYNPYHTWITVARWTRWSVLIAGGVIMLVLAVGFNFLGSPLVGSSPVALRSQPHSSNQVALDIMPVKPGGPAENFAAYLPKTALAVRAQSVVTFTIRNFDLDSTPLPSGSPAAHVRGTVGGVAYADGSAYTALDLTGIAHTFTVPALGLNVPIPGYSSRGKGYVTVTFRVRIGKAGAYNWRCMAPCGDGQDGQAGPMADDNYMRGTLFVEG